ncbi:aminotransferase-like domain-containing protein [Streptococcus oricebi]|uniref:PLP-dependent aminotransferase family protein n=1 Tax=Streptococcus oricebi TaxID=1547447 RepID=A0ABS5B3G6_9STRE|nr:PLP-dependent aminotransferase family protein [Streptococcus oricebi]MBP2622998.1 PLP-dependent aminotransferase family protein [Streptococcus oricebi]
MTKAKYQIIIDSLKKEMKEGKLKTGDKIPSIRKLAQDFHCSKDTAQKALIELKYQKYIYAAPKSGYYVLEQKELQKEDLVLSLTDDRHQAYEDFRLCVNEALIGRENYLFNYYPQQEGLKELRQAVSRLLLDAAVYTSWQEVVMTAGTQQALYILSQIDFPNQKKTILVEQPTYHRMNALLTQQKLPYQSIQRTPAGIDLAELERIFQSQEIKFFYTIPRFHYPLGHSYSRREKEEILRLAQLYDVYIIEDDYLGDFDSRRELTFHYLDQSQHVLYLKSFSTSLFPALRITALLLPDPIKTRFIDYKASVDYDSNLIMQKALAIYIDNLMYEKNRSALLKLQEEKMLEMEQVLKSQPLPLATSVIHDGILLDLRSLRSVSSLKHSGLGLDFFEDSYLADCPYHFAKVKFENLDQVWPGLKKLLANPEKFKESPLK